MEKDFLFRVESYFGVAKQVSELNFRDCYVLSGGFGSGLTIGCNGYIIGFKTKEGRGSAHYELIWEIPV